MNGRMNLAPQSFVSLPSSCVCGSDLVYILHVSKLIPFILGSNAAAASEAGNGAENGQISGLIQNGPTVTAAPHQAIA